MILIFLCIFIFLVLNTNHQSPISLTLSERAKEFITKEQSDGTGIWNRIQVLPETTEKNVENESTTLVTTKCASFSLPFSTIRTTVENDGSECTWKAMTTNKSAHITFQIKKSSSLVDDASYILRKRSSQYIEVPISSDKFTTTSFYSNENATLFIFTNQTVSTLTVSPPIESKENQQSFFESILSTFNILPNSE